MLRFILFFFIGLLLFSCRKDPVEVEEPTVSDSDSCVFNLNDQSTLSIVFGDTSGMSVLNFNIDPVSYPGSPNPEFQEIGVWCESQKEVRIESDLINGPAMSQPLDYIVSSISDIEFSSCQSCDTTYEYLDTVYNINGSTTYEVVTHYFICQANAYPNLIQFTAEDALLFYDAGEVLNMSDTFLNQAGYISRSGVQYVTGGPYSIGQDSSRVNQYKNDRGACNGLELGDSKYIGVKKTLDGVAKLGWIKLTVIQGGISIDQAAIQK